MQELEHAAHAARRLAVVAALVRRPEAPDVRLQDLDHLLGGERVVDAAARHGAVRHAAERGRHLGLGKHQAAVGLDVGERS